MFHFENSDINIYLFNINRVTIFKLNNIDLNVEVDAAMEDIYILRINFVTTISICDNLMDQIEKKNF